MKDEIKLLEYKPLTAERAKELVHDAPALPTADEIWIEEHRLHTYDKVEPTEHLCAVDGVGFIPQNDLTFISGEAGQGKTLIEAVIIAVMLSGKPWGRLSCPFTEKKLSIAIIETEMTPSDAMNKIFYRTAQVSGLSDEELEKRLSVFQTSDLDVDELNDFAEKVIDLERTDVLIIDNIADFTSDANEQKENKALIHKLNKWTKEKGVTIICTTHTNPGDPRKKMNGAHGTFAKRKAGSVLFVYIVGDIFNVSATKSRNKPMPSWSVCYDENDNVVPADKWAKKTQEALEAQKEAENMKKLMDKVGKEQTLAYDYLLSCGCKASRKDVMKHLEKNGVAHATADRRCKTFIEKNLIPYDEAADTFYIDSIPVSELPEPQGVFPDEEEDDESYEEEDYNGEEYSEEEEYLEEDEVYANMEFEEENGDD